MTDRTVKVSLVLAAQGYMSGMDQVARKTAETGSEIEKLNQKRQVFTAIGASAVGFGASVALGVGMAISRFAEFDQQMSYVQAATHETTSNMNLLRDAALEAGARTVYSATEAAGAIEELAKAGVSTSDILSGGLDAALDLAAAGGLDVAQAAGIAATALKTFNLEGEDMSHVADLLAAGAGKAMGDVSQLAQALAQGGQVAKSTGLSIEETTGALSAFASQGLLGSDAGTSFKSMLQRLTPQSAEAKREMERLGISAYDATGNFIGLTDFAGNLQDALKDLTPEQRNSAMATIFGADAVRAATVLYSEGEAGIRDWISAVDDQGYAAETAAMRLDNLKGDVEQLGGAIDTGLIQAGSGANDALRSLVQTATEAVGIFTGLPEPVQQSAVYLGIAAAAVGVLGGAALIATPRIAEFRAIVAASQTSLKGLSLAAGGVTIGLGILIGVVAAIAQEQAEARAQAQSYADTLEKGTQKVTSATRDMVRENLNAGKSFLWITQDSAYKSAEKLGISLDLVTEAALGSSSAIAELERQLVAGEDGSFEYAQRAADIRQGVKGQSESMAEAIEIARIKERADRSAADAATEHSDAVRELEGAAVSATFEVDGLADAIRGFGSVQLDVNAATRGFYESVDALVASITDNGAAFDYTTEAGRANRAAVDELAKSTLELAAATVTQTGDQESANAVIADGRKRLLETLGTFGIVGPAAEDYADSLGLIPANVSTAVTLNGVDNAEARLNFLARERFAVIRATVGSQGGGVGSGGVSARTNVAGVNFAGNLYEHGKVKQFYAGGFASGIYAGVRGGIHKFAESEMGVPWETYISGRAADRERNIDIWADTGRRLGAWQSAPASMGWSGAGASPASLDGLAITGRLDLGNGLTGFVDGRIVAHDGAQARSYRGRAQTK